jgi:hypothetical protein
MSFDVEEYVSYQIANAPLRAHPFPHFYVRPVFPDDFYRRMLATFPETEALVPINEFGTVGIFDEQTGQLLKKGRFEPRYIAELSTLQAEEEATTGGDTWKSLAGWMLGKRFRNLIIDKFVGGIRERFGENVRLDTRVEARFVRDFTDYSIAPHTDLPAKLVSLLFYLPGDESISHLGTSLYVPKDPALRCDGKARHAFEDFRKVMTAGFVPNAVLGFLKTDQAFHGVELIKDQKVERNVLLYNIYVNKVVAPAAAGGQRA